MEGMFQEEQPSKHRTEPQETKKWMEELNDRVHGESWSRKSGSRDGSGSGFSN